MQSAYQQTSTVKLQGENLIQVLNKNNKLMSNIIFFFTTFEGLFK